MQLCLTPCTPLRTYAGLSASCRRQAGSEFCKAREFTVSYWGSHPDAENDDCYTAHEFETLEQAEVAMAEGSHDIGHQYLELDGPGVHRVLLNPHYCAWPDTMPDHSWRHEQAMQAGMAGGCDWYNDEMGY